MSQPIPFRRRLAGDTAASVATNAWSIVLALGTLPLVLHGLGTESFGIWVLLLTFSATSGWVSIPANGLSVSTSVTWPWPPPGINMPSGVRSAGRSRPSESQGSSSAPQSPPAVR